MPQCLLYLKYLQFSYYNKVLHCITVVQMHKLPHMHMYTHTQAHTHIKCGKMFKEINACENSNTAM